MVGNDLSTIKHDKRIGTANAIANLSHLGLDSIVVG